MIKDVVNEISTNLKGKLIPDKAKYGKNFRAISESALLDALNPELVAKNCCYTIKVLNHEVKIEKVRLIDQSGRYVEKLQFIAIITIALTLIHNGVDNITCEAVGMGIDDGDKASGKAYTYAVKYALLKLFRLQYSDDSDTYVSIPISEDLAAEVLDTIEKKPASKKSKSSKEELASDGQRSYIRGLIESLFASDKEYLAEFHILPEEPSLTKEQATKILTELKKRKDDLPF